MLLLYGIFNEQKADDVIPMEAVKSIWILLWHIQNMLKYACKDKI
jgi:hypothetical protein